MGHIPEQIPETGGLSVETRSRSLMIYAPADQVVVHSHDGTATIEMDWETVPAMRAAMDQAQWVQAGTPGEPFQGVVLAVEVHTASERIAVVPTADAARRLAALGNRAGLGDCFTRAILGFTSPQLAAARADERQREADGRAAEAERTWQLAVGSFMNGSPIAFATLYEGRVSSIMAGMPATALDNRRKAFKVGDIGDWIQVDAVRFAQEGDGAALLAIDEIDDLTEEQLTERLSSA